MKIHQRANIYKILFFYSISHHFDKTI